VPVNVIRLDAAGRKVEKVGSVDDGALQWAVDNPGDYPQLSRIDVYGDTEVDAAALELIIEEWRRLVAETTNDRELAYVLAVRDVLDRARQTGSSVRFLGD
jgi:hypothetical protein